MTPARRARTAVSLVALGAFALGALGCRGEPLPTREPFIAFERDLADFRSWEAMDLPRSGGQGLTHVAGVRREYLNRRPPKAANAFPVGTIIVKELLEGAKAGHTLFAMVKRGGGYNARGAAGWEWFELRQRTDGSTGIVWRGVNAPNGEGYGGDPNGTCNPCHTIARNNDSVRSAFAQLQRN